MAFVGIFWLIVERDLPPVLLVDRCLANDGEIYGDFLTFGGHYDYWEHLSTLGAAKLRRCGLPTAPAWSEYEEWPRGRVVHHIPTRRFIVYADRKLQQPPIVRLILEQFQLPEDGYDLRSDRHYVSTRAIAQP